jgi:hypothetical protein
VPAALPHPTSPYKGEETASGEGVKPVHEYSGLATTDANKRPHWVCGLNNAASPQLWQYLMLLARKLQAVSTPTPSQKSSRDCGIGRRDCRVNSLWLTVHGMTSWISGIKSVNR